MRRSFDVTVIGLVLLVQLALVMPSPSSGNVLAGLTYRQEERTVAMDAMKTNRTPETVAAFNQETQLAMRYHEHHQLARAGILFAIMLVCDAVGIYLFYRYGRSRAKGAVPE